MFLINTGGLVNKGLDDMTIYKVYRLYNTDISDQPDLDLPILYLYKKYYGSQWCRSSNRSSNVVCVLIIR